jgi:alkanesulfonate monooxygenase SsuD/methylene tetrahydromethanopterin reductase-like flavin-dependent oxidoreductase (luciferase family)
VPADSGVNFAHFVELARIAERGLFDMLFFADQAAIYNDTTDHQRRKAAPGSLLSFERI